MAYRKIRINPKARARRGSFVTKPRQGAGGIFKPRGHEGGHSTVRLRRMSNGHGRGYG